MEKQQIKLENAPRTLLNAVAGTPNIAMEFTAYDKVRTYSKRAVAASYAEFPRKICKTSNGKTSDELLIEFLRKNLGAEIQLLDHTGEAEPYFVVRMNGLLPKYPKGVSREGNYLVCCSNEGKQFRLAKLEP